MSSSQGPYVPHDTAELAKYESSRHLADARAVSKLSPYIHSGQLSARQVLSVAEQHGGKQASKTFWRRLVWRDLAYWQLHHWPEMPVKPIRAFYEGQVCEGVPSLVCLTPYAKSAGACRSGGTTQIASEPGKKVTQDSPWLTLACVSCGTQAGCSRVCACFALSSSQSTSTLSGCKAAGMHVHTSKAGAEMTNHCCSPFDDMAAPCAGGFTSALWMLT